MGANHQPSLPACASWRKVGSRYANHAVTERSLPRYGVRQPARGESRHRCRALDTHQGAEVRGEHAVDG
jgi:hypothetical protein